MMARKAKRKEASLNPGTLSPNPWDLSLSGQNVWHYTGDTRTEDKAPQGCDLSADLSAGMITGGCHAKAAQTQIQTRPRLAYCRPRMVLTKGSTLLFIIRRHFVVRICAKNVERLKGISGLSMQPSSDYIHR